jgi:hypothetical protein
VDITPNCLLAPRVAALRLELLTGWRQRVETIGEPVIMADDENDNLRRAEEHVLEGRRIVQMQKGLVI